MCVCVRARAEENEGERVKESETASERASVRGLWGQRNGAPACGVLGFGVWGLGNAVVGFEGRTAQVRWGAQGGRGGAC